MKSKLFLTLIALVPSFPVAAPADAINFDDAKAGAPPAGWTATQTGEGSAKWTVEKDGAFKEAGKVGVWTKADSVTLFDDLAYGEK